MMDLNNIWRRRGFTIIEATLVASTVMTLAAVGVPSVLTSVKNYRITNDSRIIAAELSRSERKAAASFTRSRLRLDLIAGTYQMETWSRTTSTWGPDRGAFKLQPGVTLGFSSVTHPPAGTQTSLAQATACTDNSGVAIADSVCVVFNSRGWPITSTGVLTSEDAIYLTNGTAVFAVTVSAVGTVRLWRSPALTENWQSI